MTIIVGGMGERWAAVDVAPEYDISSEGRVRRLVVDLGDVLTYEPVAIWHGEYPTVTLDKPYSVHRLVLTAFREPANGRVGHHKDGRKWHSVLDNLEWTTRSANTRHGWTQRRAARRRELAQWMRSLF